ncbi:MAG: hypothetical protein QXJ17_04580 [Nitrososphaeria archaeon]
MRFSPFYVGLAIGFIAVFAQAFLGYTWINSYAFCMVGHPRDFIKWVIAIFTDPSSAIYFIPLLTSFGVLLGSALASIIHKDFKLFYYSKGNFLTFAMLGFIVINFGLIVGACPVRLLLMSTYGDAIGFIGIFGYVVGITLAIYIMRRSVP